MKIISTFIAVCFVLFGVASQVSAFSIDFSDEGISPEQREENRARTMNLVKKVEQYMDENEALVGFLARRGTGDADAETGVADTDNLDLTGMAHTGFIIKRDAAKDSGYITFNQVRDKGAKKTDSGEYDLSVLKVWGLPQFFIDSFEKDAIVFLPEKTLQLKLWNLLLANGALEIDEQKRFLKDKDGGQLLSVEGKPRFVTDRFIRNGIFTLLYNPEYNLLSDYAESSTQNCNEHLLKTYIGVRDYYNAGVAGYGGQNMSGSTLADFQKNIINAIESNYHPGLMVLSRTKSTFAFTENIRFGERYAKSPTFLGFKLKKERFDVVSVDSFTNEENQKILGWNDFKVFREQYSTKTGWFIEDFGKNYVKINRFTGKKNTTTEK